MKVFKIIKRQESLISERISILNRWWFKYCRRTPKDSYLDPEKTLNQLFDQIRMSDPKRFPAVVEIHGEKFKVLMERFNDKKYSSLEN